MARKLIGQFPNLREPSEIFIATIASILGEYPAGVVQDCINPHIGIARGLEWLSIEKLVSWCDARLAHHQMLASYKPRPPERQYAQDREFTDEERARGREFMQKLAHELAESAREKTQSGPRVAE